MNFWVEWWPKSIKESNSHAQMREQLHWEEPKPENISRRYFSSQQEAIRYAKSIQDRPEFFYRLKQDYSN
ncbi:MAG TPA: hypothetical protein EYG21_06135 [Nitrospinaceae bacterium]|jgi:hypothetical protein|nr:hypothetical protein [Nitrospinaceae bacterium]